MKKFLLITCAAAAFTACLAASAEIALDLPQMGEPADASISPAEEQEIGSRIVAEFYSYNLVLEDPEVSDYVSSLGWKLAASSSTGGKPPSFNFFVVNDPRINAFALPGGYIGVNAGLITSARNESELAGVMGHEQAHVTQRHIARAQEDTGTATLATWAAVLAAIIMGSANPDLVIAALSLGTSINYQRQVNYTRAHELEADRIGIRTMVGAGYDPDGMATFFARLEQQSRLYGSGIPEILRTHPVNTTRISEARSRAAGYGPRSHKDSTDYVLMQARVRVLIAQSREAVDYFSGELGAGRDALGNRYGLALALSLQGRAQEASETLAPILAANPRQVNLNILQAQLQLAQGRSEQALAICARTANLYPRYAPALLNYAETLIALGRAKDARQLLLAREQALGTRPETHRLLAQAAHDLGNTAEEAFQTANYRYGRGDMIGALDQLDAALRLTSLTSQDRARLRARRDEVWDATPRELRLGRRPT
jgi:predicted Zn-dependent protease